MDNTLHCDIDLPSQIMFFVSLKLRSNCAGRTGTITCKSGRTPSADSPRLGPLENRAGTPVQLAIDFLPLLDLSIVGSLFNLAINWESSSRMSCSIFFLSEWGIHFLMYCVLNTSNLGKWLLDGLAESRGGSWWRERERAPFLKGRKYWKGGINTGFVISLGYSRLRVIESLKVTLKGGFLPIPVLRGEVTIFWHDIGI